MADSGVRGSESDRPSEILACACRVIVRDGVDGLRMASVAAEAGVSNALVHYYFATREELVRQAFEFHERRETLRGLERGDAITDPSERIRDALAHELADEPMVVDGWVLWSEMHRLAVFDESTRSVVADRSRRWVAGIAEMIRAAQAAGGVAPTVDADAAALRLTALVDGLGWHLLVGSQSRASAIDALDTALGLELGLSAHGVRG